MNFKEWMIKTETLSLAGSYKGGIFQRLVAATYKIGPVFDPSARPAFEELAQKLSRQNDFLRHNYNFIPSSGDHYANFKQLRQAIDSQRQAGKKRADMYVYAAPPGPQDQPDETGHPVYSNDQNVMIRGVHDAIAHLGGNHPFSARGEYGAYNRHLKTLCNVQDGKAGKCMSAAALFTEIIGQISYYYIYNQYAPQKVFIMKDFDHFNVGALSPNSRLNQYFVLVKKDLVTRPDFSMEAFSQEFPELASELNNQISRPKMTLKSLSNTTNQG